MLVIYQRLFADFTRNGVDYVVFKGLDHLSEDLDDARGDVDIWIRSDIQVAVATARATGFFTVRWSFTWSVAFVMIGWDATTGSKVMIHVHRAPIALRKRSLALLVFCYTGTAHVRPTGSPRLVTEPWFHAFERARIQLNESSAPRLVFLALFGRRRLALLGFRFSPWQTAATYLSYLYRFVFLRGKFRIARTGLLVAFTGIDGSGKSSVVADLASSDFLREIGGTRSIYFGNHHFWIPGLEKSVGGSGGRGALAMGLSVIDRKFRVVPALAARCFGGVILCDRYFYDELVSDPTEKYLRPGARKRIVNAFVRWMPKRPDESYYLRVDASVAHTRKPAGKLAEMRAAVKEYDAVLPQAKGVTVVDANQPLDRVLAEVRSSIIERFITLR
jgi:thymidylate kinase